MILYNNISLLKKEKFIFHKILLSYESTFFKLHYIKIVIIIFKYSFQNKFYAK